MSPMHGRTGLAGGGGTPWSAAVLLVAGVLLLSSRASADDVATRADVPRYRFSVSSPYLSFVNFEPEESNVHMYELHVGFWLTPRDQLGVKAATWKLFGPMGIQMWDPLFRDESEYYPGRLAELGAGITYKRLLWRGLFAQVEVLPLRKTYLDTDEMVVGHGFKLYTSYHLGYHLAAWKGRLFIEPQVHCNYWPIDTGTPRAFQERDDRWSNYFLFEPNLYIGFNFGRTD